jgi:hypothetical protein
MSARRPFLAISWPRVFQGRFDHLATGDPSARHREPRRSKWVTESGFRLIRVFSIEHNAERFRTHVTRECKSDRRTPSGRRFAMKLRRMQRAKA